MLKEFRYLVDVTKAAMAAHPGSHVIRDSHAGGVIVALCPITEGDKPVCEGDWSFAPLVQRALEHEAVKVAFDGRISLLVEAAYREGRRSMSMNNEDANTRAWNGSAVRTELKRILADKAGS